MQSPSDWTVQWNLNYAEQITVEGHTKGKNYKLIHSHTPISMQKCLLQLAVMSISEALRWQLQRFSPGARNGGCSPPPLPISVNDLLWQPLPPSAAAHERLWPQGAQSLPLINSPTQPMENCALLQLLADGHFGCWGNRDAPKFCMPRPNVQDY